ncbi:MAG: M1 family aminopeptidase, partial [Flavobacteriales bacterium]
LGFFVIILYIILRNYYGQLGVEQNIYRYNFSPDASYSVINGYGISWLQFIIYKVYWAALAFILLVLAAMFWKRDLDNGMKWRLFLFKRRFNKVALGNIVLGLILFFTLGGYIYHETNIEEEYVSSKEREKRRVEYEKKYGKYEEIIQPRITSVNVDVDIYPYERELKAEGTYWLTNKADNPIDTLHVNYDKDALKELNFFVDNKVVTEDTIYGYNIYNLGSPLMPGDSIKMNFRMAWLTDSPLDDSPVIHNGTFFNSNNFPSLGYNPQLEISGRRIRKKYDLPPKERMAPVNDTFAMRNTYISNSADWINFETTVSTSKEQIAIAPGYLQKKWTENGRQYFHYKMGSKILNFYSYLSADLEVHKDAHVPSGQLGNKVDIAIYHHKKHTYNLERMVKAVKDGLDYYTENFSDYQHRQVRIIEFPRNYGTFAQSFPNTIPYSESIGFIAKVDKNDPEDIDYPYYVTAHELGHQWWAHQVVSGNVRGATVMSETMAQYSSLMVMENQYGKSKMRKFLKYELDKYLKGRRNERRKELPLILNENQQYIHYRKGSVVMYGLKDLIGEDNLNRALSRYIDSVAFQDPPYTNSLEFMKFIRSETPDSLEYYLDDMFADLVFYKNKVDSAYYEKTKNGKYRVNFTVNPGKYRVDSLGNKKSSSSSEGGGVTIKLGSNNESMDEDLDSIPMKDWIDIGIFTEKEKENGNTEVVPVYLKKHKFTGEKRNFSFTVDEKPVEVGIDPYNKLVDKDIEDNRIEL